MTKTTQHEATVEWGRFVYRKPTKWGIITSVVLISMCLVLGFWQVQRLEWKNALIAQLQENSEKQTMGKSILPEDLNELREERYRHIILPGKYHHKHEFHLIANSAQGQPGYDILTPFEIADDGRWILVDRGWVPMDKKAPEDRPEDVRFDDIIFANGVIIAPEKNNPFMPDHDVENNIWFNYDIARINEESGLTLPNVVIQSINDNPLPGSLPHARRSRDVSIMNNHKGYAMIWFSLAFAGLMIFFIYHLKEVREDKK